MTLQTFSEGISTGSETINFLEKSSKEIEEEKELKALWLRKAKEKKGALEDFLKLMRKTPEKTKDRIWGKGKAKEVEERLAKQIKLLWIERENPSELEQIGKSTTNIIKSIWRKLKKIEKQSRTPQFTALLKLLGKAKEQILSHFEEENIIPQGEYYHKDIGWY